MNHIVDLCKDPLRFPISLTDSFKPEYTLKEYNEAHARDAPRLFPIECTEGLVFWDYNSSVQGKSYEALASHPSLILYEAFEITKLKSIEHLKAHLGLDPLERKPNPACRFL